MVSGQIASNSEHGYSEGQRTYIVPACEGTQLRISQEKERIEVSLDGAEAEVAMLEH